MDQNDKNKEVQLRGKCVTRSMMVLEFKPNLRKFCSILHVVLLLHPKTTICDGFGITLSQFFAGDERVLDLTKDQEELLKDWNLMDSRQQELVKAYIQGIIRK